MRSYPDRGYSCLGSLGATPLLARSLAFVIRALTGVTLVKGASGLPRCLLVLEYLADAAVIRLLVHIRAGVTLVMRAAGLLRCLSERWLSNS